MTHFQGYIELLTRQHFARLNLLQTAVAPTDTADRLILNSVHVQDFTTLALTEDSRVLVGESIRNFREKLSSARAFFTRRGISSAPRGWSFFLLKIHQMLQAEEKQKREAVIAQALEIDAKKEAMLSGFGHVLDDLVTDLQKEKLSYQTSYPFVFPYATYEVRIFQDQSFLVLLWGEGKLGEEGEWSLSGRKSVVNITGGEIVEPAWVEQVIRSIYAENPKLRKYDEFIQRVVRETLLEVLRSQVSPVVEGIGIEEVGHEQRGRIKI